MAPRKWPGVEALAFFFVCTFVFADTGCQRDRDIEPSTDNPTPAFTESPNPTNPPSSPGPDVTPTPSPTPTTVKPGTRSCTLTTTSFSTNALIDYGTCLILGRSATQEEKTQWLAMLNSGEVSPLGFLLKLGEGVSFESGDFIDELFLWLLERQPTAAEHDQLATKSSKADQLRIAFRLEDFSEKHPLFAIRTCTELKNYQGGKQNTQSVIQGCISDTPAGTTLELPPGTYLIDGTAPVSIKKRLILRTALKDETLPPCDYKGDSTCAEFIASVNFRYQGGILQVEREGKNVLLDHLVVNGNYKNRQSSQAARDCREVSNQFGMNIVIFGAPLGLQNTVSKFALCGTAYAINKASGSYIYKNTAYSNGLHVNTSSLWSDGITVIDASNSRFIENQLIDNTDVDLIFGGCRNCVIKRNKIEHTTTSGQGSFAAFMLTIFPGPDPSKNTSGDFEGTPMTENTVDCGTNKACGFGFMLGFDPWDPLEQKVKNGAVFANSVKNAQQGFNIDDAINIQVYDNSVSNSGGGSYKTSCGSRRTSSYNISRSSTIAPPPSGKKSDTATSTESWDRCIANWF